MAEQLSIRVVVEGLSTLENWLQTGSRVWGGGVEGQRKYTKKGSLYFELNYCGQDGRGHMKRYKTARELAWAMTAGTGGACTFMLSESEGK